jgi:Uma2 family endonuclease
MATVTNPARQPNPTEEIPPLENGDHLSLVEFERRYNAMPGLKKAELIEGVVHMPSPVSFDRHAEQHLNLATLIGIYIWQTPGVRGGDNATTRLDLANEPQPDATLIIDPSQGGQARISTDGYIEQAPELVAEVASSSVSIDTSAKFKVYQRNGVQEYVIWRVLDREFDWFILKDGKYEQMPPDETGVYHSQIFPGLWLNAAALIGGDMAAVRYTLEQGLASPEHVDFVSRLNSASPSAESNET